MQLTTLKLKSVQKKTIAFCNSKTRESSDMICQKEKKCAYLQIKRTKNKNKFTQSTPNLTQRFQIMKKTCLECSLKITVN